METVRQRISLILIAVIVAVTMVIPLSQDSHAASKKPKITSITVKKETKSSYKVTAKWKKVKGAKEYHVMYCYNKRFEAETRHAKTKGTSATKGGFGLTKGTNTIYVKVAAKVGKKKYWSNVKYYKFKVKNL